MGFFETFIKDSGNLGRDFAAYYKGNPKLGDTPSLLYMMKGNPTQPEQQSWGGKFVKCSRTPRKVIQLSIVESQRSKVARRDYGGLGPTVVMAERMNDDKT